MSNSDDSEKRVGTEFLSHENVYLRGVCLSDYTEGLFYWANDEKVTEFMVTGLFPSTTPGMEQLYAETCQSDRNVVLAIVDRSENRTIGLTGLYDINAQARHAEFRILIGEPSYWSKGIGSACAEAILRYAFERLNFNKIWLGVNESNTAALQSYQNTGFVEEGRLRSEVFRNSRYYDVIRMSVLAEEFFSNRTNEKSE